MDAVCDLIHGRRRLVSVSTALALVAGLVFGVQSAASAAPLTPGVDQVVWGDQIGGDGDNTQPFGVAIADDGSVYVVGGTFADLDGPHSGGDGTDAFIRKYDPNGDAAWTRQWGVDGFSNNFAADVAIGPDGDVYVVGALAEPTTRAFIRRYDPDGNLLWDDWWVAAELDENPATVATGIAVHTDGNVYVLGWTLGQFTDETQVGEHDIFIRKFNQIGADALAVTYTRQFGTAFQDEPQAIAVSSDGESLYTVGFSHPVVPSRVGYLYKHSAVDGSGEWSSAISSGEAATRLWGVAVHADGTIAVSGDTQGDLDDDIIFGSPNSDAFVRTYAPNGTVTWTRQFGDHSSNENDSAYGVAIDPEDGSIILTGTWGGAAGALPDAGSEVFVRIYNPTGQTSSTRRFDSTGLDGGHAVAVAGDLVAVAGSTTGSIIVGAPAPTALEAFVAVLDISGFEEPDPDPEPPLGAPTVGLFDPSQGQWHLRNTSGIVTSFYYGNPGDYPIMGDWDCNGTDTVGMFRQSNGLVYLKNSNSTGNHDIRFFFGNPGDIPIVGDFNDDGCDTVSIYRPSNQTFYIINALGANDGGLGAAEFSYVFGNPGDKPFTGDFDGDGIDTVGLHRESSGFVYFRNTHTQGNADAQFFFGNPNDRFITGDWNGNFIDSPAIFRPGNTTFYFRFTNTQGNADDQFVWGSSGWLPVSGVFGLG